MIEINLLPDELAKKNPRFLGVNFRAPGIKNLPMLGIAITTIIILAAMQLALFFVKSVLKSELASVTAKSSAISPQKREAEELKVKVADINKRSGAIDELVARRFSWARKIGALSDCVTPGIWFSELYYDERPIAGIVKPAMPGALVISGYASGVGDRGMTLIGKLIKSLQDNKDFYSDITNVGLVSTKSDKAGNQDVISFRITCTFK